MAEDIDGFNIGLKLDTIQVEKGLTGLKRELKTTNSEMKNQLSAFEYSERSVEKYSTKLGSLEKKLEVQKRVTAEAKKEYEELASTNDENSKRVQEAEKKYNDQAAALGNLERNVESTRNELKELEKEQKIANSKWTKMGDGLEAAGGKMQTAGKKMTGVGNTLTKGVTAPILGIGAAAIESARKTGEHADKVINAAEKAGMGTTEYQELSYALKQVGLEEADVDRALGRLNQRMGRAADGNDKYKDALEDVGISQKDLKDGTYDTDEAFIKIVESLQQVESKQERSAKASEIFGTSMSRKLMPAINGGSEELEKLKDQAHDAGGVMSGKALEDSREFKLEMEDLKEKGAGLVHELGAKLAPTLTDKLIPAIEQKGIPMLEKMVDGIVDLVDWYSDLDDGTKTWIKRIGGLAIAAGPALSVTGKLTQGIGGMVSGLGRASKAIGVASGSGLVGTMSGLSKAGAVGLAIAGVGALAAGIYKVKKRSDEAKETNLDVAESFQKQASDLEGSIDTYDSLRKKTKLSGDELKRIYDLNKQISETNNPGEIEDLTKEYEKLAEDSGLSGDEIENLFDANDDIIKQTPGVEQTFTERGDAMVKSTDKAKDYVDTLEDMMLEEIRVQRDNLEEERKDNLDEIKDVQSEIGQVEEEMLTFEKFSNLTQEEANELLKEKQNKLDDVATQGKEAEQLQDDINELEKISSGNKTESYQTAVDTKNELHDQLDTLQEEEVQLDEKNMQMAEILLANQGITEEGEKGLETLDKQMEKNNQKIEELEKTKEQEGNLSKEKQEQLDKAIDENGELEKTKEKIYDETGLYSDLNGVVDSKLKKLDESNDKTVKELEKTTDIKVEEGNVIDQIQSKNEKINDSIAKKEREIKKNGDEDGKIQDQIDSLELKKTKNNDVIDKVLRSIGLNEDERKKIIESTDSLKNQESQHDENNRSTSRGIRLEEDRTFEAGKDVDKTININPSRDIDDFNDDVGLTKDKIVRLQANPVGSKFTLPLLKGYAQGTGSKGHPGGLAQVNDGTGSNAGQEIIQTPSGQTGMLNGKNVVADLPKGSHVWSAKQSKSILGNLPQYAKGTGASVEAMFKGVTKKGLAALTAAKIGSAAAGVVGLNGLSGITSSLLPILGKNLTTNPDNVADYFGGSESAPGGAGVERWRGQVTKALAKNGLSTSKVMQDKVLRQIKTESGGNEKTVQSPSVVDVNTLAGNPARGLMQTIPQTFHANKHKGHGDIYNGYDNMLAALRYAKNKYGSSLSFLGQGHGYEKGTNYVPEDQWAYLHKGEKVIPEKYNQANQPSDAMKLFALFAKKLSKGEVKEKGQNKKSSELLEATQQQNNLLSQQNAQIQQQTSVLMQILNKETDVNIDADALEKSVTKRQNRKSNRVRKTPRMA